MSAIEEKPSQKGRGIGLEAVVQVVAPPTIEDEEFYPDGGLRAWLVVVGCCIISAVVVGFWYVLPSHVPKSRLTFP